MKKSFFLIAAPLIVVASVLASAAAYEVVFWNKIYPGISVGEIPLGNQTYSQAFQILSKKLTTNRSINLVWGTSAWNLSLDSLGVEYDIDQTAKLAVTTGRSQSPWREWRTKISALNHGVSLTPVFSINENRINEAVASISAQIDIPAQEPGVSVDNNSIVVTSGENGQAVDTRLLLQQIKQSISQNVNSEISIPVKKLLPKLSEGESQILRDRANKYLSKQIQIKQDGKSWVIPTEQIVSWIDPSSPQSWREDAIATWIQELAQTIDHPADNALFTYVGEGKVQQFKPAVNGISVKQSQFVSEIITTLNEVANKDDRERSLEIPVITVAPAITTEQVNNLGIKELIARGDSNYTGSIPNRVFNLHKAANNMNGILIAPGEEFSFNKYIGDISAAGGYKQAYVIKEGRTVLGDGGGVCQVSTTMFRAALNAGLPITERHAHAYRVHYYENDSQPGYDATIFTPSVDFKFKNDTPGYILIQTVFDDTHNKLAFEFYGTKDGREATVTKSRVWDVTPPPPALYQDDPTLAAGKVQQVDFAAWGAKASFDYKVVRDGQVLQKQTFYSNYTPWQAIFLRGTRTN